MGEKCDERRIRLKTPLEARNPLPTHSASGPRSKSFACDTHKSVLKKSESLTHAVRASTVVAKRCKKLQ